MELTERSPENFLPHISGIIGSIISTEKINGSQTAFGMVLENAGATLSRAGIGFAVGTALGFILALLMSLFDTVEKIAFPYLMLIQMIPVLGLAPLYWRLPGTLQKAELL